MLLWNHKNYTISQQLGGERKLRNKNRTCLSKAMNVAVPKVFCFKNWIHFCAVSTLSTTMLSSGPQAVDTAPSYFSSIAPRSPSRPKIPGRIPRRFWSIKPSRTRPRVVLAEWVERLSSNRIRTDRNSSLFLTSSFVILHLKNTYH